MKPLLQGYKEVGQRRYREIAGLYYEDEPGDVFEHRLGRTILDVDTHHNYHSSNTIGTRWAERV